MTSRLFPSPKCIVFVAFLHILLPLLCRHLPFSFYFNFDPSSAGDENKQEERAFDQLAIISRSEKKLADIARSEGKLAEIARKGEQKNPLAVLVLTAKRRGVSYLGRSLLALHKEVHRAAADHQHLVFVCTLDSLPASTTRWCLAPAPTMKICKPPMARPPQMLEKEAVEHLP